MLLFFQRREPDVIFFLCSRKKKEEGKKKKTKTMEPSFSSQQPIQQVPPRMTSRALELLPPVNG